MIHPIPALDFSLEQERRFQYAELEYHIQQSKLSIKEVMYHAQKCKDCINLLTELSKKFSAEARDGT